MGEGAHYKRNVFVKCELSSTYAANILSQIIFLKFLVHEIIILTFENSRLIKYRLISNERLLTDCFWNVLFRLSKNSKTFLIYDLAFS